MALQTRRNKLNELNQLLASYRATQIRHAALKIQGYHGWPMSLGSQKQRFITKYRSYMDVTDNRFDGEAREILDNTEITRVEYRPKEATPKSL
jgi:hypothetical protein